MFLMELRNELVLSLLKVDVGDTSKYRSPVESKIFRLSKILPLELELLF
jgi:hypothetical protein